MGNVLKADSNVASIIAGGEKDPYVIQDKLKQLGLASTLDRIKEKIIKFEKDENMKFASNADIDQRFNWIVNFFSNGEVKKAFHMKKKLYSAFYDELGKYYKKDGELNPDIKKKAADAAVETASKSTSALPAMGIGAAATMLPTALYKLLKGESALSSLPMGALGALLGYGYHNLPEDMKFGTTEKEKP